MTPRERVLAATNGEEAFPLPSDVFENGVHPELRAKLLQSLVADSNKSFRELRYQDYVRAVLAIEAIVSHYTQPKP